MKILYAPSILSWLARRSLYNLPLMKGYLKRRDLLHSLSCARKAAQCKIEFAVESSGWAVQTDEFQKIRENLKEIDRSLGLRLTETVWQSTHWSRIYEYPYAVKTLEALPFGSRVLDCGAGLGSLQFFLAKRGFQVYSFDVCMRSLRKLAGFKKNRQYKTLFPSYGSVYEMPFPSNFFDGTACISVIEHLLPSNLASKDMQVVLHGILNEQLRVLKKEGQLVLTFDVNLTSKTNHRLSFGEYVLMCAVLGIKPQEPPANSLCSSDTEEGRLMGEDVYVYCVTLTKSEKRQTLYEEPR